MCRSRREGHRLAYCDWLTLALTTVAFCCFWSSSSIVILLPWMLNLTSSPRAMLAGFDQGKLSFWRRTYGVGGVLVGVWMVKTWYVSVFSTLLAVVFWEYLPFFASESVL